MKVRIGECCTIADDVQFGEDVVVWGHANLYGCQIGKGSRIGTFVEIQKGAVLGERIRVQSHSFICSDVVIEDDVFIGHNVSFINDRHPSVARTLAGTWRSEPVRVCRGASIGTGAIIMGGVTVGEQAVVGAGSLVLKDVPPRCVVAGVPARVLHHEIPPSYEVENQDSMNDKVAGHGNGENSSESQRERQEVGDAFPLRSCRALSRVNPGDRLPDHSIVHVPFVDLKQQYGQLRQEIDRAVQQVCETSQFIMGPEVGRFENRFAQYIGAKDAVGVGTGTDALTIAAWAMGLQPGDHVLMPANTFIATALAVHRLGAVPIPVDVDPDTFHMDLADAERRFTLRTKMIIPVHLYGRSMDMHAVTAFARERHLLVLEDACQAHGARWNGTRCGAIGDAAAFSFFPAKNLGAYGDGGAITTNDPEIARKARLIRNYGSEKKYEHLLPGTNSRLDSLQAAVLNVKLDFLDTWNRKRFHAACRYRDALRGVQEVILPDLGPHDGETHVFHLFVVRCSRRDELSAFLAERGIQSQIHYPLPIHLQPALSSLGLHAGSLPQAELLAGEILSLPMFPEITDRQIDAVAAAIRSFYGR